MATALGVEPRTLRIRTSRSNQLSYAASSVVCIQRDHRRPRASFRVALSLHSGGETVKVAAVVNL